MTRPLSASSKISPLTDDKHGLYFNVTSYVNVVHANHRQSTKVSRTNSQNLQSPPNPPQKFNFNHDDQSYHCDEIADPTMNYYQLDFRKMKFKSPKKILTSINLPQYTEGPILRRRSLTTNSLDYYSKRSHVTYADLLITKRPQTDFQIQRTMSNQSKTSDLNYLEIDFNKTEALKETDRNIGKSKKSKPKSDKSPVPSVVALYRRWYQRILGNKQC